MDKLEYFFNFNKKKVMNKFIKSNEYIKVLGYIEEFKQKKGEFIINSVTMGGAYVFLLNLSEVKPLLIMDTKKSNNPFRYLYKSKFSEIETNNLNIILTIFEITSITINHLIWSQDIPQMIDLIVKTALDYKIKIIFYLHDFYTVCPSVNLLNYKKKHCNIPSELTCNNCLESYDNPDNTLTFNKVEVLSTINLHHLNITKWRKLWSKLFVVADTIIVPSTSTMEIWKRAFPEFGSKVKILHHNLQYLDGIQSRKVKPSATFFQIYIIGEITEPKGKNIVDDLLELIKIHKLNICINILGIYNNLKFNNTPFLKLHESFSHNEIAAVLNNKEIHCFIMPSICPETFSYVTQEMIATSLPIIGFNLGAQGQFIGSYENGELVQLVDSQLMFKAVEKLYQEYRKLIYPQLTFKLHANEQVELEKLIRDQELLELEHKQLYLSFNYFREKEAELERKFLNSMSWMVTAPLRKIAKTLREIIFIFKARFI